MTCKAQAPSYDRYKGKFARVIINRKSVHLGIFDSEKSHQKYRQLIAEWSAGPRVEERPANEDVAITVAEVFEGYRVYAEAYYGDVPRGRYRNLLPTITSVGLLCADLPAHEFTPKKLKVVRQTFIEAGYTRGHCNHGHDRVIALGPKAQDILRKYLLRRGDAPCFSPGEALAQQLDRKHERRATPISCGNKPRPDGRKRAIAKVGDRYTVASYRRAIERACDRAFPTPKGMEGKEKRKWQHDHRWTPHRLRHTAGTLVREKYGLDGVQVILGHRNARVSEIYSELHVSKAVAIARKIG